MTGPPLKCSKCFLSPPTIIFLPLKFKAHPCSSLIRSKQNPSQTTLPPLSNAPQSACMRALTIAPRLQRCDASPSPTNLPKLSLPLSLSLHLPKNTSSPKVLCTEHTASVTRMRVLSWEPSNQLTASLQQPPFFSARVPACQNTPCVAVLPFARLPLFTFGSFSPQLHPHDVGILRACIWSLPSGPPERPLSKTTRITHIPLVHQVHVDRLIVSSLACCERPGVPIHKCSFSPSLKQVDQHCVGRAALSKALRLPLFQLWEIPFFSDPQCKIKINK